MKSAKEEKSKSKLKALQEALRKEKQKNRDLQKSKDSYKLKYKEQSVINDYLEKALKKNPLP